MAAKLTCIMFVVAFSCHECEVLAGREGVGGGRHTMQEWPRREHRTKNQSPQNDPSTPDVCVRVECDPGRRCTVTAEGEPTCVCIQECARHPVRLLCASDGMTYTSECQMMKASCRNNIQLTMLQEGPCPPVPEDAPQTGTASRSLRKHPVACFQDQRDSLQRDIVERLRGIGASGQPGVKPYEMVLEDCFTQFDETEDNFLEPTEFLKFVEHNQTLMQATDNLNRDYEEDTLLRELCIDALLAEADENFDWMLSLKEFKTVLVSEFHPPTRRCSLEGKNFSDGEEKRNRCNFCVCACGNWVCTVNVCDGSMLAGAGTDGYVTDDEENGALIDAKQFISKRFGLLRDLLEKRQEQG